METLQIAKVENGLQLLLSEFVLSDIEGLDVGKVFADRIEFVFNDSFVLEVDFVCGLA